MKNKYDGYQLYKNIAVVIFIVINFAVIVFLQTRTVSKFQQGHALSRFSQEKNEQILFLNLTQWLPRLGFENIIADWIYLNFIQYFGDTSAREITGYDLSSDFFQKIIELDPRFVNSYLLLEPATTLFAGKPEKSVEIMSKGVKSLSPSIPNAYLVWIYKAVDELLFLKEAKAAQKSYKIAAEWALKNKDQLSQQIGRQAKETALFLNRNPNSNNAQISSWLMILSNAKDKKTAQLALDKIRSLGGDVKIEGNKLSVKFPQEN
jgi:tetratricopeptide (TPR) repeat protein